LSTFVLLTITGLGLGAMYFLVASGLSLIYGLMGVLNFAHGALITVGAYAAWWFGDQIGGSAWQRLLLGGLLGIVAGAVVAGLIELVLIRPLYRRPVEQVLVTVGLALAIGALVQGIWGADPKVFPVPAWMIETTTVFGASIPNDRFVEIGVAVAVLVGLTAFLRYTRFGLVIRAGVENRAMVAALGIDVRRAFTIVFALGGALAALAIVSHTELLLLLIGGLFVIETGSVIVQRAYFKLSGGKRIFLMSPIHHHFELKGWAEVTVVVRFWIIAIAFALAGVASLKLR